MSLYVPPAPGDYSTILDQADLLTATQLASSHIETVRPYAPGDGSPGYLALLYQDAASRRHSIKMHLTVVADPYNYSQMLTEADRLAGPFAQTLQPDTTVDGFATYNAQDEQIFAGLLSSVNVGSHPSNALDSNSYSVTVTGRGLASGPGLLPGNALVRFFHARMRAGVHT